MLEGERAPWNRILGGVSLAVLTVLTACGAGTSSTSTQETPPPSHSGEPTELDFAGAITGHWSQLGNKAGFNCTQGAHPPSPGQPNTFVGSTQGTLEGKAFYLDFLIVNYHGAASYVIPPRATPAASVFTGQPPETGVALAGPTELWDSANIFTPGAGGSISVYPGAQAGEIDVDVVQDQSKPARHAQVKGFWACAAPKSTSSA